MTSVSAMILWWTLIFVALTFIPPVTSYTILGGIDQEKKDDAESENSFVTEKLRHLQKQVELRIQSHEPSGRVSMAGTLWEASPLLADYITNPACPLEAFQRMRIHDDDDGNVRLQPQPATVVELGSGVGLASLAAAFLGCRVFATDGSPSSIRLMNENFEKYAPDFAMPPRTLRLDWGDMDAAQSLIQSELCCLPDVIMASDVVYSYSAREELAATIRLLCPKGHLGRVVIAHRWRTDPADEGSFFESFDDDFDREEVGLEFLPDDGYHRTRNMMDMRYPISIFEMRRKC